MTDGPYIAEAVSLIGDPARANMLGALMDGRALTAKELGFAAGVAPSTASEHLSKLTAGKLVAVTPSGRHRYFRLASPEVARALETLMGLALDGPPRHRPKSRCDEAMARARTCYDHFAGRLGVSLADSFTERNLILLDPDGGQVTETGRAFFGGLGIDLPDPKGLRRVFCRPCLDWSERRWHIGGAVGAAIARRCFEAGWTERQKHRRAVTITPAGKGAFAELGEVRV
jgi:DNA-binding transcriptional ArsR family regulator